MGKFACSVPHGGTNTRTSPMLLFSFVTLYQQVCMFPLLPVIIPSTWQPELGPSVRGFITCAMNTFWPLRYYLFSVEQMWRDGCIVSKGVASNVKEHRGTNEHLPYFSMCMYISYAIMMAGSNMPLWFVAIYIAFLFSISLCIQSTGFLLVSNILSVYYVDGI